ncbi:MAG: hypothetical protein IPL65_01965 [Lewinellaceae bacterium]|nr:hypothetical protein [Lewinellaceae bacterium]
MTQTNRILKAGMLILLLGLSAFQLQAQPQQVYTGMYLMNLYDLNMDEHSFYADFYIWFKWNGDLDPTGIEFVNAIEKWSMSYEPSGEMTDTILANGMNYRIFRAEGRFFHSFALNRFPLDRHLLDIQIENPEYDAGTLLYLPDSTGIRQTLNLVGWNTAAPTLQSSVHDYGTDFGNPEENARQYSNLTFNQQLSRPVSYFLLKMLLPLLIVVLVSIGALLLHPSYIDTRSSLPIGGLLTAVFLQQSYSDALPDTGYMVLMDKLYLLAYVLISLVLLQVIRSGNKLLDAKPSAEANILKLEKRRAMLYLLLFGAGVVVLCL